MKQNLYKRLNDFKLEVMSVHILHILIPPTSYVGFILHSTTVASASHSTVVGTIGYSDTTVTESGEDTAHAVAAEYPHSTHNGTATCSSHSGTR